MKKAVRERKKESSGPELPQKSYYILIKQAHSNKYTYEAHANYLECYVCEDCEESEGKPVSCALLGELQLIDPTPHTANGTILITTTEKASDTSIKPPTSSQVSAGAFTSQGSLTNNLTTIPTAFDTTTISETLKTTAATQNENITTPTDSIPQNQTSSRPQIIVDSMESYEDMEYDFGNPTYVNSSQLQHNTKNTKDIIGLTDFTNNISLTEGYEGNRPTNESSIDSALVSNLTNSTFLSTNGTNVLGLSGITNESLIFDSLPGRPNNTNLTEFNTTRFEYTTLVSQAENILDTDDSIFEEHSEEYSSESEEYFPWLIRSNALFENSRKDKAMRSAKGFTNTKYGKLNYDKGMKQLNITYKCYTVQVKGQNKVQVNKGCIAVPPKRTACELLSLKYDKETLKGCQVCLEDKCNRNNSNGLKFSFKSLLSVILVAWLLY
ncbi:uncharacterized protein LOC105664753 isoform X1 [Ceratitis capitata]|nr:uncharacterized protein LOC105664753 isoform X1 [Ceratitis capitata]